MTRRDKKIVRLLSVVIVILFLFACLFTYRMFNYYTAIKKAALLNELAREIVEAETETTANYRIEPAPDYREPTPNKDNAEVDVEPIENKTVIEKILTLREAFSNDDIVGYLNIEGTSIDYAVAQSADNEFYLRRDLNGEKSSAGTIFMDFESDAYELGKHTVIYGHNMRDGSMFHNLRYYNDLEYYKEHRFVSLTTPYKETMWEIFAFYKTTTDFYYIQVIFPDDDSFASLISVMKEKSLYNTGVEVGPDDRILTLSTCANTSDDSRYVLNAKLVE